MNATSQATNASQIFAKRDRAFGVINYKWCATQSVPVVGNIIIGAVVRWERVEKTIETYEISRIGCNMVGAQVAPMHTPHHQSHGCNRQHLILQQ